jgi:hypothetical protein
MLMVNMVFLEFFYDLSDRDIEEECTWNMLFKCFPGLRSEKLAQLYEARWVSGGGDP